MKVLLLAVSMSLVAGASIAADRQTEIDLAQCELEAWKVTGRQIDSVYPDGSYGKYMPAFNYHQLCMKAKGYVLPDEESVLMKSGLCKVLVKADCWEKPSN